MNSNYRIFICTHKDIPFDYKKIGVSSNHYTILSNVKGVNSDCCDVIDMSEDEFVKEHRIGYSEMCSIHYLYTHQELIKDLDYIGICHYRRFYQDLLFDGAYIDGDIVTTNNKHRDHTNYREYSMIHCKEHIDIVSDIVLNNYKDYYKSFIETLDGREMHHCNMVVLPKSLFFEYCEYMFGVLSKFDEYIGVKNDQETYKYVCDNFYKYKGCASEDVNFQSRLQGYLSERLTDSFIRNKSKEYKIHHSKMVKLFSSNETINNWEEALAVYNSK